MPIYEYACEHCGHHLEMMQKISEDPAKQCPNCHKDTLTRLVSAAGFRLKGGGWYETDFKDTDKKRNLASGDSEKPTDDAKTADSKAGKNPASTDTTTKNETTDSKTTTPKKETSSSSGNTTNSTSNPSASGGSSSGSTSS